MLTRRSFAAALPLLAACQNTPAAPTAPTWRQGPDAPYATQEIYPALHRERVWIAGGFSPDARGATERVIVFDPARESWADGPALPAPAHHVHLAALDGDLYAIGGYLGGDTRMRWICTPRVLKLVGETWVEAPVLPAPVGEAAPIVHDGRIHLIGGRAPRDAAANAAWEDQADIADHFVFANGAWARAAPLPMARNSAAGVSDGALLHVVSGRTVESGQTGAHHVYDPGADRWSAAPDFPEPRGGLAAAFWRGRLVAGGGEIFEPPSVGTALYAFNADGWRPFETLPVSRHGYGMISAGDALLCVGGAQNVGGRDTLARLDIID